MFRQGSRVSLILALVFPAIISAAVALAYYGYRYAVASSVRSKVSLMEGNQQLAQLLISQVQDRIDAVDYDFFQQVEWEDRLSRPTPEVDLAPAIESFVILDENLRIRSQVPPPDPRRRKPEMDRWQSYVRGLEWKSLQPWAGEQAGNFRHLHQLFEGRSVLIAYAAKETALGARYYVAAKLNLGLITKEWLPDLVGGLASKRRIVILDEVARSIVGGPIIQRPGPFLYEESFGKTLYAWRIQITPLNVDELRAQAETERLLGVLLIPVSTVIIAVGLGVVWLSVRAERRASQLKSDFIANVSHELKTPLSLIRMFAELLATGKHKGEGAGREYAGIITRESDRLAHLIDNVLDFARLERGKASYNFAEGRMQEVVERALEVCRFRLEKEKIRLRTDIAADLPLVRMDEDAMTLVLLNLVDNAAKYGGDGGDAGAEGQGHAVSPLAGEVWVKLARVPGGVALSVRDRGSGISAEDQKRIFERFYRADNARVRNVRGSGIGLSLVKHIAESHGGRVEVESAPGQGATFTVFVPSAPLATSSAELADVSGVQLELPVAPGVVGLGAGAGPVLAATLEQKSRGRQVSGGPPPGGSASPAGRRRVLIIEDEPDLVRGLRDALEFEGFEIVASGVGREGVRLARERAPDLVLLDLMLPDMNGFTVCEEVRATNPVLPIIMLTARSQETDKIRGLDAGADDYVTKPFSIGELVARINAIFRRLHRASAPDEEIRIGQVVIHPRKHELIRNRKTLALSFYEVELLRLLYERAGQPVPREEILDKIWGVSGNASTRSVDNFVVKLRKKIEENAAKPRHIVTIYGTGYKLVV